MKKNIIRTPKHLVPESKMLATRTQNTLYQNSKHFVPKPKTRDTRPQNKGSLKLQAGTYFPQYGTFPLFCSNVTCIYHVLNIWQ